MLFRGWPLVIAVGLAVIIVAACSLDNPETDNESKVKQPIFNFGEIFEVRGNCYRYVPECEEDVAKCGPPQMSPQSDMRQESGGIIINSYDLASEHVTPGQGKVRALIQGGCNGDCTCAVQGELETPQECYGLKDFSLDQAACIAPQASGSPSPSPSPSSSPFPTIPPCTLMWNAKITDSVPQIQVREDPPGTFTFWYNDGDGQWYPAGQAEPPNGSTAEERQNNWNDYIQNGDWGGTLANMCRSHLYKVLGPGGCSEKCTKRMNENDGEIYSQLLSDMKLLRYPGTCSWSELTMVTCPSPSTSPTPYPSSSPTPTPYPSSPYPSSSPTPTPYPSSSPSPSSGSNYP